MDDGRYVLKNARHLAADVMRRALRPGDVAVDATMGNGHDTLFLAELVGETGHVYAFDVQPEAVSRTRERLEAAGLLDRVTLCLAGHETIAERVAQGPQAIMFNLGWLPGAAHAITTQTQTTLRAVSAACELLAPGGVLTVCIYPGHEEGTRELKALTDFAAALSNRTYNALWHRFANASPDAPQMLLVQRNP